jgi:cyclohexadienyl dehydratase
VLRNARRSAGCAGAVLLALAGACGRVPTGPPILRIGLTGDYPPFSDAPDGTFVGLDVDVARRFAHDAGRQLELVRVAWPALAAGLVANRFDLAMGGVTLRPERAVVGRFTRPMLDTAALVLARRGVGRTVRALDRPAVRLAVHGGGHLERVARRLFPRATLIVTTDNAALAGLVRDGTADALLTDDIEADVLAPLLPDVVRVGPLTHDRKAYLGRDPRLVGELDAWLRAREADGTLAALRTRWLGAAHATPRTTFDSDLDALLAAIDLRLALMPAVAAAKEARGLPITDPSQEARVLAGACADARAYGVDAGTIETLFRAQMAAARAVQRRARTTRPRPHEPLEALDLARDLRPALAALSTTIVARAADVAADPARLGAVAAGPLVARLDAAVSATDRAAIARAVLALRRASGVGACDVRGGVGHRVARDARAGEEPGQAGDESRLPHGLGEMGGEGRRLGRPHAAPEGRSQDAGRVDVQRLVPDRPR